jgi:hypothetical protein
MNSYLIPLTNTPQQFEITLNGVNYSMTCKYNDQPDGGWLLDIANADTDESIVAGLPLVTGVNLLEGLEYLEFGGELWVYTDGDPDAPPTLDNLGTDSNLYFLTETGTVNG